MNTVKSTISSGYRWRLILITFIMLGFGAYCIYDWQIGYPKIKEIGLAYVDIKEANPDDYPQVWKEYASERGWKTTPPKKIKKASEYDKDIFTQLLMAMITVPLGLFFLFKLVRENGRWVAMDENGITASGGHTMPWDSIKSLNEEKWKTKGIALLHYTDANGSERKVLLDDFKQEREPTTAIVSRVQQLLNPDAESQDGSADLPPTEIEAGNVYAYANENGTYAVSKILAVDEFAVHVRLYEQQFDTLPERVSTRDLKSQIGHAPMDKTGFSETHTLIAQEAVEDHELEGYRVYLEMTSESENA
ncbi:hypothetical protein [Algisphaera agarilytica]|uniref:Uncharacterized protein n=1 Tax=Algisphaera agarilytica TaxID=1385975 RepID=A0A7X0H9F5_9BACT|nr:hypothetical protein [Algisphaera agarilytica]MBB6431727.1 hypothetical protein [Algisphaera agarilytica]